MGGLKRKRRILCSLSSLLVGCFLLLVPTSAFVIKDTPQYLIRQNTVIRTGRLNLGASEAANNNLPLPHKHPISTIQSILVSESIEDISTQIASRVVLPFYVPPPIITAATTLAVQTMATDLSPALVKRIGEAAAGASSDDSEYDDISSIELDDISEQIAVELNAKIDLPVLDEEQEHVILKSIGRAVMVVLTSPDELIEIDPKKMMDEAVETAQDLLCGRDGRMKLAKILNAKVDFPLIDENGEEQLLLRALDACADRLVEILPPELIDALRGQHGTESLEKTKEFVVANINKSVDIIGLSEDQEAWIIRNLVDVVMDALIGDTEAELLLMSPDERRDALIEKRTVLKRRIELSRRRYEAERTSLEAQIRRIDERLQC